VTPATERDPEVSRALEQNILAFFSRMAGSPGGTRQESPQGVRICSGVPYAIFNWVLRSRFSEGEADRRVAETVRYFEGRRVPFTWGVGPGDRAEGLRERLVDRGFTEEHAPGMALDLSDLPSRPLPEGLALRPVRNIDEEREFCRTLNAGDFQESEEIARAIPDVLRPTRDDRVEAPSLDCFVGYWKDRPVCTSALFVSDGVAGIWGVATVPHARRRGFGAAATVAALGLGRSRGCSTAVLVATTAGEPVYRRLGFREVFRFTQYQSPTP